MSYITRATVYATLALGAAVAVPVRAQTWDGGGANDNLNTGANWNPNGVPGVNANVIFGGIIRLTPNVSSPFEVNGLTFDNTAGGFLFGGGSTLSLKAGGLVNNDASLQTFDNPVSFALAATSTINAAAGNLALNGTVTLPTGTLTLSGPELTSVRGAISGSGAINKTGAGGVEFFATGTAITADLNLNAGPTFVRPTGTTQTFGSASTIAVNGTSQLFLFESTTLNGAQLTRATGATIVVEAGTTLTVRNGGDVVLDGLYLHREGSTILVTGAGSTFATTQDFRIEGFSTLNVAAGGAVSSQLSRVEVGTGSGKGTVTVDGSGSSLSGVGLRVGALGSTGIVTFTNGSTGAFDTILANDSATGGVGTIEIQSGATVTGGSLLIATNPLVLNGTGSVTITGAGSALSITGAGTAEVGAQDTSTGALNVEGGGTFNSGTGLTTVAATGVVNLTGGTFVANGNVTLTGTGAQLNRDAGGAFNLAAGKTLTIQAGADASFVGGYVTAGGNVTVTGPGSTFQTTTNSGFTSVRAGSTLAILGGGAVVGAFLDVGNGSSGTLTVDGAGSSVVSTLATGTGFWGANGGAANLTFSNAATASFAKLELARNGGGTALVQVLTGADVDASGALKLADSALALSATLTVDGPGSTWTQGGNSTVTIGAASASAATLNVQNGGAFSTGTGTTSVNATGHVNVTGGTFNANGNVLLSGQGAQLNRDAAGIFSLFAGRTLTVEDGADATFAGNYLTGGGNLAVNGAGSTFQTTAAGALSVNGGSTLGIQSGGSVSSAAALNVGVGSNGTLTAGGAGSSLLAVATSTWGGSAGTANVGLANAAAASVAGLEIAAANGTAMVQVLTGASVTNTGGLVLANGAVAPTGTLTVDGPGSTWTQAGGSLLVIGAAAGGTATLNVQNGGTFVTGAGTTTLNATGTVNIDGGTLTVNGPIVNGGGTLNFAIGALNLLGPNNLNVGAGGLLGADLTLLANRQLTVAGTTTVQAFRTLTIDGGTLRTGALVNNGTLDFRRGTLALTGPGGLNVGSGPLGGSVTLGPGALLQVANLTTVAAGGLLRIDGGSFTGAAVVNDGTIDHRDGTLAFTALANTAGGRLFVGGLASPAGFIDNAGHVTLQNGLGYLGGAGMLTNTGVITGDGVVARPVTNAAGGEIRVDAGDTLGFTAALAPNAGRINLNGGTLDVAQSFTNAAAGQVTGRGSLNFAAGFGNAGQVNFSAGLTDVRGTLGLLAGSRVIVSGAGTATFYGPVNGVAAAEFRVSDDAAAVFFAPVSGPINFTGGGTKYFEAGVSAAGPVAAGGLTVVQEPATLVADHVREASLTVNGQVTIRPNGTPAGTSKVAALNIGPGGTLDLTDNALVVDYAGTSPLASIRAAIIGGGLTSTALTSATALGYGEAAELLSPAGGNFRGQAADGTAVLVRYTLAGDATLDGTVDFNDLVLLAQNYNKNVAAAGDAWWFRGDFTYDGVTDFNDLVRLAQNYNAGLAPTAPVPGATAGFDADLAAAFAAVPEPAATAILAALAACGLVRRRRFRPH